MNQFLCAKHFFSIFIPLSALLSLVQALPRTDPPIPPVQPFQFFWNAPTERCGESWGPPLDLSLFHSDSSPMKTETNQIITFFSIDHFGIHPHVEKTTGDIYDQGLPQLIDLQEHLKEAEEDINYYMPTDRPGLAVLDFEDWSPQWVRNMGSLEIYRKLSIKAVKQKNPSLSAAEAEALAKDEFEHAAKEHFIQSIRIGKKMRPQSLWGYFMYPDCDNEYEGNIKTFTGECPPDELERNDELLWLWKECTALFPSVYVEPELKDSRLGRLFVRHRIQEAMRVSTLPNSSHSIPVYTYIRPVCEESDDYMSALDLVNTIGEAAALGAAGVISWGDMDVSESEESCSKAQRHLERVMNPYILNVSTATQLCSRALCQNQGRCVRKRWDDDVFLHLDPTRYRIQRQRPGGPLRVSGSLSYDDVSWFDRHFDCMCYGGEEPCRSVLTPEDIHNTAGADGPRPLLLLVIVLCLTLYEAQNM